ncbi:MAG: RNA pseudouridine synthase [Chlamydiales bacterium]|nr:RNA pseudouridine synthase [Chlamydiales bacterium]
MKLSDKDILFLDNHLLVVNKPKGIPTQPSKDHAVSLETMAKDYLKEKSGKESVFLHAIFRLDKPVGGIVVFARTSKALSRLNEQMREKKIKKTYLAIVEKMPPKKKDTLRHFHQKGEHYAIISNHQTKDATEAVLHYEVIKENPITLKIDLITGKYHQIRAQLSFIGCPIVGDKKYGSNHNTEVMLKHVQIEFKHPVTHIPLTFNL